MILSQRSSVLATMCNLNLPARTIYTVKRRLWFLVSLLILILIFGTLVLHQHASGRYTRSLTWVSGVYDERVTLVIASQKQDDTSWLQSTLPEWNKMIYVSDDPDAPVAVPANRGREGMAYLTYV